MRMTEGAGRALLAKGTGQSRMPILGSWAPVSRAHSRRKAPASGNGKRREQSGARTRSVERSLHASGCSLRERKTGPPGARGGRRRALDRPNAAVWRLVCPHPSKAQPPAWPVSTRPLLIDSAWRAPLAARRRRGG